VIVAGCAGSTHPVRPPAQVRLARENEFPRTRPKSSIEWLVDECKVEGTSDRQLYGAAITYARRELVAEITRRGFEPRGTDVHFKNDRRDSHKEGVFTEISVDPGSTMGRMSVGQFEWINDRSVWGTSDEYCVHVLEENGATILVLELLWSLIS
jgi:hypothetical protein